eukprot:TRINITY_DN32833_c0_g1_i1.p1 TRINITY_DN32833_c0_g1~~TRINITY_DN32833_c0_g1_i1.p1  ORF type:complete len:322 (+),score=119.60 TRINITY_DN32833_c0_g1_i1:62-1027(+)
MRSALPLLLAVASLAVRVSAAVDDSWEDDDQKDDPPQLARKSLVKADDDPGLMILFFILAIFAVAAGVYIYTSMFENSSADEVRLRLLQEKLLRLPPCDRCGKKLPTSELCPSCQVVAYCGPDCMRRDRDRHGIVCDRLKAIREQHDQKSGDEGRAVEAPPDHAVSRGYFVDWADDDSMILRDALTFFAKYRSRMVEYAVAQLPGKGRGVVLADVSTERFKALHAVEDPLRLMYITASAIGRGGPLSLFDCDHVTDLVCEYDPQQSLVVAFTNGMNYVTRTDARCPVILLPFDLETSAKVMRSLTQQCIVTQSSPKSTYGS